MKNFAYLVVGLFLLSGKWIFLDFHLKFRFCFFIA